MPNTCPSEAHTRTAVWTDWRRWYACMACCLVREEVINTRHVIMFCLVLIHLILLTNETRFPLFTVILLEALRNIAGLSLYRYVHNYTWQKWNLQNLVPLTYHWFLWCWGNSGGVYAWGSAALDSRMSFYERSVKKKKKIFQHHNAYTEIHTDPSSPMAQLFIHLLVWNLSPSLAFQKNTLIKTFSPWERSYYFFYFHLKCRAKHGWETREYK